MVFGPQDRWDAPHRLICAYGAFWYEAVRSHVEVSVVLRGLVLTSTHECPSFDCSEVDVFRNLRL
jgi:hypothetical protein